MSSPADFWIAVTPFLVLVLYALLALPMVIGVIWIRPDANRFGQPGWLWALATIPLNWVAVLAYLVVRASHHKFVREPSTPA